jgi:hypothetical protein
MDFWTNDRSRGPEQVQAGPETTNHNQCPGIAQGSKIVDVAALVGGDHCTVIGSEVQHG